MSLLNNMLKDLDKRQSNSRPTFAQTMSADVRMVPTINSTLKYLPLLVLLTLICASLLFWEKRFNPAIKSMAAIPPAVVLADKSESAKPARSEIVTSKSTPQESLHQESPHQESAKNNESYPEVLPTAQTTALKTSSNQVNSNLINRNKNLPLAVSTDNSNTIKNVAIKNDSPTPDEVKVSTKNDIQPINVALAKTSQDSDSPMIEKNKSQPLPESSLRLKRSIKIVTPTQVAENAYRQGVIFLKQGRMVEAEKSLREALNSNPLNFNARQLLVDLMVDSSQQNEAISLLEEGLRISPGNSQYSYDLARLQVEIGDAKLALSTLKRGLPLAGNNPEYHSLLGTLLQGEEQHQEAVNHFLVALNADSSKLNDLVGIGISLQALGQVADATEAFTRARQSQLLTSELAIFVDDRLKQLKQLEQ